MSDKRDVSVDGNARVAYELMHVIASGEGAMTQDRNYWLTLFFQCVQATRTGHLSNVLNVSKE
jgi:hypothetical protein